MTKINKQQSIYMESIDLPDEKQFVAEWCNKKELMKIWRGLNINTLNKWLCEMRASRRFRVYVINPTHNLVFINIEGFREFLIWKQLN